MTKYIIPEGNNIVIIDAGHGSLSPHKKYEHPDFTFYEGIFNRSVKVKLISKLIDLNISSIDLVPEEEDITLSKRVARIKKIKADHPNCNLFVISIHGNAHSNQSANGYEVYTSPGQTLSDKIATIFFGNARELDWKMRSDTSDGDFDKEARFYILIKHSLPAILVEAGFYSNPDEARRMLTDEFQNQLAENMAKSVQQAFNTVFS